MNPILENIYNYQKKMNEWLYYLRTANKINRKCQKNRIIKNKDANAKTEKKLIQAGGGRKKNLTKEQSMILKLFYLHHIPILKH